ncbi:class I SAM-dependent methyltransferase [Paenibacillus sp. FSL L8-0709]|uniref:class I SAM-dependent methyltransferase n=1 Tax=Paenibacillus sp. FSL L8-0709 TaxID=2975312 RepID=UPI0030F73F84
MNTVNHQEVLRWDKNVRAYSQKNDLLLKTPEQRRKWSELLKYLLRIRNGSEVLDVGTGPGFLALQIASLGYQTTGVDLSREMLHIAVEKAKSMNLNCSFIQASAEKLPFLNASFDAVVSRHLIGALLCPESVYQEWGRLLKPGGRVVIIDGDRRARNEDPFTSKVFGLSRKRFYGAFEREKMRAGEQKSKDLEKRISLDLENAGFNDIETHSISDVFRVEYHRYPKEHYQRILITARKP